MDSALALLTDTHIAKQIAIQLSAKGIDVVRLEEVDELPNDATDEELLIWATENQRAVLSLDNDFRTLHYRWMAEGRTHNGIFWGHRRLQGNIGVVVNFIANYAEDVIDMGLLEDDFIELEVK